MLDVTTLTDGWVRCHLAGERREEYHKGALVVWFGTNSWRIAVDQLTHTDGRDSLSAGYDTASDAMRAVDTHQARAAADRAQARATADEEQAVSVARARALVLIDDDRGRALIKALARLHAAGRIQRPWLNGMFVVDSPSVTHPSGYSIGPPHRVYSKWLPPNARWRMSDIEEPATKGCLLALLREASGDPHLGTVFSVGENKSGWSIAWNDASRGPTVALSEGVALADALIALGRRTESIEV